MSWTGLPKEMRDNMAEVLTPKQLVVMQYVAQGMSMAAVARALDIDRKSVRERFEAGARKLRNSGIEFQV